MDDSSVGCRAQHVRAHRLDNIGVNDDLELEGLLLLTIADKECLIITYYLSRLELRATFQFSLPSASGASTMRSPLV